MLVKLFSRDFVYGQGMIRGQGESIGKVSFTSWDITEYPTPIFTT